MLAKHPTLQNRVAVITGGSGVLCSEMAKELAAQGMRIAILNLNQEKGQKVANQIISQGGDAIALSTNVLDKQSLINARDEILRQYGQIDLLIRNRNHHPY